MIRYYTPEKKEFCEGFNYEAFIPDRNSWSLEAFHLNESHIDLINKNKIRVKYLNTEDIESLGWEKDADAFLPFNKFKAAEDKGEFIFVNKDRSYAIVFYENSRYDMLSISQLNLESNIITLFFAGAIKNKSELMRVLKQVEI